MAGRPRGSEERRCSGAAHAGHHCPHHMSIVQTAISSVCRSNLSLRPAGTCPAQHAHHSPAPPAPAPPLAPEFSLSAPGLSPCQQGPGVLNKKVHSSKIKDLKTPRLCLPERCFSEQPARDMPHFFASIPSWKQQRRKDWLVLSVALPWCLAARARCVELVLSSPAHQPSCIIPATSGDPFTIPHLK